MMIGIIALGMIFGMIASVVALFSGAGILAALGVYAMVGAGCSILFAGVHVALQVMPRGFLAEAPRSL